MTPDLMEAGHARAQAHRAGLVPAGRTASGGRSAGWGRPAAAGAVDVTQGRILYL